MTTKVADQNAVIIDIDGQNDAPVPATTKPMCSCCTPSRVLMLGAEGNPFAFCSNAEKIYKRENGQFVITDYKVDPVTQSIFDADGIQVYPIPAPSSDEILNACRGTEPAAPSEQAGDSKPATDQRERVDLGRSNFH